MIVYVATLTCLYLGSVLVDAWSTHRMLRAGGAELNPLLGTRTIYRLTLPFIVLMPLLWWAAAVEYRYFAGALATKGRPMDSSELVLHVAGMASLIVFGSIVLALNKVIAALSNLAIVYTGAGLPDLIARLTRLRDHRMLHLLTMIVCLCVSLPSAHAIRAALSTLLD